MRSHLLWTANEEHRQEANRSLKEARSIKEEEIVDPTS